MTNRCINTTINRHLSRILCAQNIVKDFFGTATLLTLDASKSAYSTFVHVKLLCVKFFGVTVIS